MQALKTYLKTLSDSGQDTLEAFAKLCGTNVGQLRQIAGGFRPCRESLAINIERESKGAVTCEELRPDVDWAVIRASKPKRSKAA